MIPAIAQLKLPSDLECVTTIVVKSLRLANDFVCMARDTIAQVKSVVHYFDDERLLKSFAESVRKARREVDACAVELARKKVKTVGGVSGLSYHAAAVGYAERVLDTLCREANLACPLEKMIRRNQAVNCGEWKIADAILVESAAKRWPCIFRALSLLASVDFERVKTELESEILRAAKARHSRSDQLNLEKAANSERATNKPKIRPCDQRALNNYKFATQQEASLTTDRAVYDWLSDCKSIDKLPEFSNWSRYLRRARRHYGESKNTPKSGLPTRSVVKSERL